MTANNDIAVSCSFYNCYWNIGIEFRNGGWGNCACAKMTLTDNSCDYFIGREIAQKRLDAKFKNMGDALINTKRTCTECGWIGEESECEFGHDDFICPKCGKEALK